MIAFNNRQHRLIFIGGKILVSFLHTEANCLFADPEYSMAVCIISGGSISYGVAHIILL